MLPPETWQQLKATDQPRLAVSDGLQAYLQACQETIKGLFPQLVTPLAQEEALTLDEAGMLHLLALDRLYKFKIVFSWNFKLPPPGFQPAN